MIYAHSLQPLRHRRGHHVGQKNIRYRVGMDRKSTVVCGLNFK